MKLIVLQLQAIEISIGLNKIDDLRYGENPEVEKILTANGIYVTTKNNVYTQIDFIKQFTKRIKARVVLSGKTSTSNLDLIRMWVEDGKLKPYIEKTFSLSEFKDAYQYLAKGRTRGKLVINME